MQRTSIEQKIEPALRIPKKKKKKKKKNPTDEA